MPATAFSSSPSAQRRSSSLAERCVCELLEIVAADQQSHPRLPLGASDTSTSVENIN